MALPSLRNLSSGYDVRTGATTKSPSKRERRQHCFNGDNKIAPCQPRRQLYENQRWINSTIATSSIYCRQRNTTGNEECMSVQQSNAQQWWQAFCNFRGCDMSVGTCIGLHDTQAAAERVAWWQCCRSFVDAKGSSPPYPGFAIVVYWYFQGARKNKAVTYRWSSPVAFCQGRQRLLILKHGELSLKHVG